MDPSRHREQDGSRRTLLRASCAPDARAWAGAAPHAGVEGVRGDRRGPERRYKPEFWFLFVPNAVDVYCWMVQLACGCVRELFTLGKYVFPDAYPWTCPTAEDVPPPPPPPPPPPLGEFWCSNDHGDVETVYRDIVDWMDRRVSHFEADPEDCPDDTTPEVWAALGQPEPHSSDFWRVRLACGHVCDNVLTDVDWSPEVVPELVSEERASVLRREFEALWSVLGDEAWPVGGRNSITCGECWTRAIPDRSPCKVPYMPLCAAHHRLPTRGLAGSERQRESCVEEASGNGANQAEDPARENRGRGAPAEGAARSDKGRIGRSADPCPYGRA
ncbi:hypothetical protein EV380_1831 [Zhihengliuella halotolerans]|uniref:Uncharacterized protein n=1 Tax=Zhihengliuella halotolerans TaxID=370736 RepID=A0A4Q8ADG3_9MICC|nr:hypothetical protein EV380_1831 [Zhihengliuella halotolerans]